VENKDVGGLENGICKQAVIGTDALGDFIFIACASLQKAHRGYAGKNPCEFSNLGHIGLPPENGFFGIKAQGNIIHRYIEGVFCNIRRSWVACERVVVGDEVKAVVFSLELEMLAHSTEEIAYVQSA
jgi:hypothetical protein